MRLEAHQIVDALATSLVSKTDLPSLMRVSIDTRTIDRGDLYVALRGEHYDGHAFVGEAIEKGAACVLVDSASAVIPGVPAIVVRDTKRAYMTLAHLARTRVSGTVVGVTGSTGKTTTKTFLCDLLNGTGRPAVATPENENNEIGVSKFFLTLVDGTDTILIAEMGCRHPGDIAALVNVAEPGYGVLTNVGEAHLEIMGSREIIAQTKWELFGCGAHAIINIDDAASRARSHTLFEEPRYFGAGASQPPEHGHATIVRDANTLEIYADGKMQRFPIEARFPGMHNLANLAAALAAAISLGVPAEELAPVVWTLCLPHGRYERAELAGGARVVFDAYNASLTGTLATLQAFLTESAQRRITVFGSMAELGDESSQMHHSVGVAAAEGGIDVILAGGRYGDDILRGARDAQFRGELVRYEENAEAVNWLRRHLRGGDVVLLKGSRMYRMEQIVAGLRA
jgi:UDP-N-acetylmuramoyl-tripeptide--D-alanyl-D-alanine ligase